MPDEHTFAPHALDNRRDAPARTDFIGPRPLHSPEPKGIAVPLLAGLMPLFIVDATSSD